MLTKTTSEGRPALADAEGTLARPDDSTQPQITPPAVTAGVGWVVKVGSALTTLIAVVNDVLIPNSWISGWVFVLALGALGVTILPRPLIQKLIKLGAAFLQKLRLDGFNLRNPTFVKGNWRLPLRIALAFSAGLSGLSVANAPVGGVIGANVPAIHDWQVQLGIISANTAQIAKDIAAIRDDIQDVKQETSKDPRKELANLGVPWTAEAFVEALKLSDERTVRLFLDGGMSPTADYKGAAAVVYILQPGLTVSPVPMLTLLVEKGFDLDTILTDDYIMSSSDDLTSMFPPQFENQDPYLYVGKGHFRGPALLWVVIEATWYLPTDHDLETLHFLIDHGADRTIAMNYMNFTANWNDTPPYFTVLNLLKS